MSLDKEDVEYMQKDQAQELLEDIARDFKLGEYEHYKGGTYCVFAISINEATLEPMVHYYAYGKGTRWTRTLENFQEQVNGGNGDAPYVGPRFKFVRGAVNSDILHATGML